MISPHEKYANTTLKFILRCDSFYINEIKSSVNKLVPFFVITTKSNLVNSL